MKKLRWLIPCVLALASWGATASAGGQPPDPQTLIAAQKTGMLKTAMLDGQWRGSASMTMPDGTVHDFTQTERIGPMLDGSVRVIEGRSYDAQGHTVFNAFAVISYDPASHAYTMHSYAQGRAGDFKFVPTVDGYRWEIPAGQATMRYTAVIKNGQFNETGERVVPGQAPVKFFNMELTRLGDSSWPAANPVSPK
ncbi:MAG: hypothetical protein ABI178_16030 [Rhodanobacter sp.]